MNAPDPTSPKSLEGIFIDVALEDSVAGDDELARKLEEVCPVDIYSATGEGGVRIVRENLDECVLCELCIQAAPPTTVRVKKLYDSTELIREA